MAILAILAATVAPSLIRDVDRAVGEAEQAHLQNLANDLQVYIENNKIIPSATTWATAIATVSSLSLEKISQNQRFHNRGYYVDPRFFSNSDTVFTQYTQSNGLTNQPVSPRIIIASNLKGTLPGAINSSSDFNAVWDQTLAAPITESPDIKIQRINLKSDFHRVILSNDNTTSFPGYKLENNSTNSISNSGIELYILSHTKISLYDAPFTSNNLSNTFLTSEAKSFSYKLNSGVWEWDKL